MKTRLVVIITIVAIAALIGFFFFHTSTGRTSGLRVAGNVETTTVEVSFRMPGRVKERLVDEGSAVKRGDVIARLESDEIDRDVAARSADVDTAKAAVAELDAGSRPEEIAQAKAVVTAAEAEAERLEKEYQRARALYAKEVLPKQQLDSAEAARATSRARLKEVRERQLLVVKGPRKEVKKQARSRLKTAEALLDLARTRLTFATLTAPISGTVLTKNIEAGEQVAAGTPVVTMGDMTNVWVRAYIPETEIGRVKLGQKATVKTDSWPGRSYDGTVTFISSEAEFTPKNVQTEKERVKLVYRIKITIPNPNQELKPGMPADAVVLTD